MVKNTKILALLAALILLCFVAGACAGKNDDTTTTGSADTTVAGDGNGESVSAETNVSGETVIATVSDTASSWFDFGSSSPVISTTAPHLIDYNTTAKSGQGTTSVTKKNSNTTTTKKSASVTTTEPVSEMTLQELQMLLFTTDDPTTAGQILTAAGFEYDPEQDIYYSVMNPLQRNFGYNVFYDAMAPVFGMVFDTQRIYFTYDNKDWLVQLWKGQYGITVGAEIGIYYKPTSRVSGQYDCVSDDDLVEMSMILYKDGKKYFTRGPERHWWLTGFKLLDSSTPSELTMDLVIQLDDDAMADAFYASAKKKVGSDFSCDRYGADFYMHWE